MTSASPCPSGCPADSLWRFAPLELHSHPKEIFWSASQRSEGVGFEPTEPFGSPVFKTGAIDHSTTPPSLNGAGANACRSRTSDSVPAFRQFVDPRNLPDGRESKVVQTLWTELDQHCGRPSAGPALRNCRCKASQWTCSAEHSKISHQPGYRNGISRRGAGTQRRVVEKK